MSTHPVIPIGGATPAPLEPPSAPAEPAQRRRTSPEEIAAWLLLASAIAFVLVQHLVGAAIMGLTLYAILESVSRRFAQRMSRTARRPLALLIVAILTGALITFAVALSATVARRGAANIPDMMEQMADILGSVRLWLGGLGQQFIPEVMTDAEDLKLTIAAWLKKNSQSFRAGGLWLGIGLVHLIMGALLAILVFFRHMRVGEDHPHGALATQLIDKVDRFADAFWRVATAQVKISAVNTTLTGIYLLVILPLFGRPIPFGTTLVLITFICGLIPVLGNLISNSVIFILSMGISFPTAVASLTFLVVIHKLEYLINSRIVGSETDSQAWEILMAIIIGEAAFGVGGVILAPITYAFIKRELKDRALV